MTWIRGAKTAHNLDIDYIGVSILFHDQIAQNVGFSSSSPSVQKVDVVFGDQ